MGAYGDRKSFHRVLADVQAFSAAKDEDVVGDDDDDDDDVDSGTHADIAVEAVLAMVVATAVCAHW